jgi:hypothetical protein
MRNLTIVLLFLVSCTTSNPFTRETLSLAGEWKFAIDSLDQGIDKEWFKTSLSETVQLPGSMAENGKGNEVTVNTD